MEQNYGLLQIKLSLYIHIQKWLDKVSTDGTEEWGAMNTYLGDDTVTLMTDSAMNILLAQKSLTIYLKNENGGTI